MAPADLGGGGGLEEDSIGVSCNSPAKSEGFGSDGLGGGGIVWGTDFLEGFSGHVGFNGGGSWDMGGGWGGVHC